MLLLLQVQQQQLQWQRHASSVSDLKQTRRAFIESQKNSVSKLGAAASAAAMLLQDRLAAGAVFAHPTGASRTKEFEETHDDAKGEDMSMLEKDHRGEHWHRREIKSQEQMQASEQTNRQRDKRKRE